jgi:hypothetical protein
LLSRQSTVTITADNQVVTPTASFITIDSDNGTAANRTFTIANGSSGQMLNLKFIAAANQAELLDTGNAQLSVAWTPTQHDTLVLIWDDLATAWTELSRSAN